ncbi:NAD(P)H-binding protein [Streptomyces sp. ISL-44]|uniref:SDR family oxidoreductase n=1 Tax=Streptomyces sp. ISL-44 TaxID=2819184 RepID=UPI001BE6CB47|nr:NAD(P)H-binding protein [Streptomyces sp. ISL-44]MBT2540052.1 NAD(P)H-binding protein [Streptomyces sp. ISL-44]
MTTVVVTGATGNVGRHVASELRRRGIPHRALTRNPERATAVLGPGADLAQGDFTDPESLRAAIAGADMLGAGLPPWLAEGVVGIFQLLREGINADTTDSVRQLTGQDPRPVADFARDLMAPLLTS